MSMSRCFLNGGRDCSVSCTAYVSEGKTNCRLLNVLEKLVPVPTRPATPPPPKVGT